MQKEIVSYAKKAGMKYIVITAKHHAKDLPCGIQRWKVLELYEGTKTFSLQQYTPFGASAAIF